MNERFSKSIVSRIERPPLAARKDPKKKGSKRTLKLGNRFAERGIELDWLEKEPSGLACTALDKPAGQVPASPSILKLLKEEQSLERPLDPQANQDPQLQAKLRRITEPPAPPLDPRIACQTIDILLVEDNPGHVRLMEEALKAASVKIHLSVIEDGAEAMYYLHREGKHEAATRPDLILLDLNLPKKDGRDVLAEIKTDQSLGTIPVVVLTSSTDEEDIRISYGLQANCFISKPTNLGEFANVVKMIESFWGRFVSLP